MATTDRGRIVIADTVTEQGRTIIGGVMTDTGMLLMGTETALTLTATFDTDHVDLVWSSLA